MGLTFYSLFRPNRKKLSARGAISGLAAGHCLIAENIMNGSRDSAITGGGRVLLDDLKLDAAGIFKRAKIPFELLVRPTSYLTTEPQIDFGARKAVHKFALPQITALISTALTRVVSEVLLA